MAIATYTWIYNVLLLAYLQNKVPKMMEISNAEDILKDHSEGDPAFYKILSKQTNVEPTKLNKNPKWLSILMYEINR